MVASYRNFCLAKGQAPGTVRQRLEVLHLKRVALSMTEALKLVDGATVHELVAVVMGLDTDASCIGNAFGMEASKVDLDEGKIEFWVEKSDLWHPVYLFHPRVEFLREYLGHHPPFSAQPQPRARRLQVLDAVFGGALGSGRRRRRAQVSLDPHR